MKNLSVSMTRSETIGGWVYLVLQLLPIPIALEIVSMYLPEPLSDAKLNFIYFCINFICTTVIFRKYLIANIRIAFSNIKKTLLTAVCGYALYWVLSIAISIFIVVVYPEFINVNDDSISGMLTDSRELMLIGTIFLVPVTEELLYRGLVFRSIYSKNKFLGFVVSIVVFAVLHIMGYIGMYEPFHLFLCFLQYIPAGICLAWAYVNTDSIVAPILIHIFVNAIGMLSM
ncbi:MAG: CPBP family intramembrane metalloprotease [Oscillospiraceae bacterium]|nr:CPBP family intramembrane metalloprotease [Oscillospiraceae bacterium]